MKRLLFGFLIALSLVAFSGCSEDGSSTSEATKSAKCGEGKCGGDAKKAESKCGGEEKAAKCGGGK